MASVHRRPTHTGRTSYRVIWHQPGAGGTRKRREKLFDRASDAKAFATKIELEAERKGIGDPAKHTVASFINRWLTTLEESGSVEATTLEAYTWQAAIACRHIGHMPLERLSPADLDQLYGTLRRRGGIARKPNPDGSRGERALTARTILGVHRVLNNALERARKWKLIAENPARDATAPSPAKSRVKNFTADQVKQLLEAAARDAETYVITALFLSTGLRRSEMLGLAWDCADLDAATLTVARTVVPVKQKPVMREHAKTDSSLRTIALAAPMIDLLREQKARVTAMALKWGKGYQREPLLVFPGLAGAPMDPGHLSTRMRQVMRRARVVGPSPCHAWRHTSATQLLMVAGQNIKTVQTRLGHTTARITLELYAHPVPERDREAADHFGAAIKR